jgi:hypothetical protein
MHWKSSLEVGKFNCLLIFLKSSLSVEVLLCGSKQGNIINILTHVLLSINSTNKYFFCLLLECCTMLGEVSSYSLVDFMFRLNLCVIFKEVLTYKKNPFMLSFH